MLEIVLHLNKFFSEDNYDVLKEIYCNGFGVNFISKQFCVTERTVRKHLTYLGIIDSSRGNKKLKEHSYKRQKKDEFTEATKRECFEAVGGYCEYCHTLIGDGKNFKLATYHHKKLVKFGGTRSKENCMVLHRNCHEEHFYELHGFYFDLLKENYKK